MRIVVVFLYSIKYYCWLHSAQLHTTSRLSRDFEKTCCSLNETAIGIDANKQKNHWIELLFGGQLHSMSWEHKTLYASTLLFILSNICILPACNFHFNCHRNSQSYQTADTCPTHSPNLLDRILFNSKRPLNNRQLISFHSLCKSNLSNKQKQTKPNKQNYKFKNSLRTELWRWKFFRFHN